MIPKVIHYCWFGENELSDLAKKCISSWNKYCPNYKIIEWNESNFDIHCCDFVKEAYQAKKWAFVSDYARLKIIYDNGGIYLDTDVELIQSLDVLLKETCYFGEETTGYVNTGIGFGAEKGNGIIQLLLDEYQYKHFILDNGLYDTIPCPQKNTKPLISYGYQFSGIDIWRCDDFVVFPPEYFCPMDYNTKLTNITSNTISIHLYNSSWLSKLDKIIYKIEGNREKALIYKIKRVITLPLRVINKIKKYGTYNTIKFVFNKVIGNNKN